ncbi:MAG: hypothetical protein ABSE84_24300 [Isosphaeraceae bacterium]|jgi:hypothetical protein
MTTSTFHPGELTRDEPSGIVRSPILSRLWETVESARLTRASRTATAVPKPEPAPRAVRPVDRVRFSYD